MQNHEPTVTINGFVEADISKLMSSINLDNPHLFFVDFHYQIQVGFLGQTIKLNYIYNKADAVILTEKVKKVCNKILHKVIGQTEFEKELSLHDILVQNVLYDDVAKKNLLKFHVRSNTVLGVLFYKTAVCEGIAKTFKFLLNALDIKCLIVTGDTMDNSSDSADPNVLHAWNMVKIDGKAYHVDLTWDINSSQKNIIRHDYFNLTDKDILSDHIVFKDYPHCNSEDNNYFYKKGLMVMNKADLLRIIAEKIKKGENSAEFKISNGVFENDSELKYHVKKCLDTLLRSSNGYAAHFAKIAGRSVYAVEWVVK